MPADDGRRRSDPLRLNYAARPRVKRVRDFSWLVELGLFGFICIVAGLVGVLLWFLIMR